MTVSAKIGGTQASYPLSFNDIIGFTPGSGRKDAKKGIYQHRNGNVLVVYSVNPCLVTIDARHNGKKTNRTGLTRIGMFMVDAKTGKPRLVTCNREPDGEKDWREFAGTVVLEGEGCAEEAAGDIDDDLVDDEELDEEEG